MPSPEEPITIYSTFPRIDRSNLPSQVARVDVTEKSGLELVRAYLSAEPGYRCFLFNGLSRGVWIVALLKLLLPRRRSKLIVVDMVLSVPASRGDWCRVFVRRRLLVAVDLFVSYARDTRGVRAIYRIPASRFAYVPFKVNDIERIATMETSDEGYLVVAGQTRRDFATFLRAIENLTIPVRIVAPGEQVLARHASTLSNEGWPEHVAFVRDAVTPETFLPQLAAARLVVLPIIPENVTPSGISVCLVAMALGKCVVVSAGPVTEGLIDEGQAVVVPPGNAEALRDAIVSSWEDAELRARVARCGSEYARSLGGEARLHQDLLDVVVRCCGGSHASRS